MPVRQGMEVCRSQGSLLPAVEEIEVLRCAQDDNICLANVCGRRLALVEHVDGVHNGVAYDLQALGT
jgi:hypothetical protein